jgi:chemotaxis response regulator CheB
VSPGSKKIRVIVVDDSAVMRHLLSEIIDAEPDMEAIGGASDPLVAREMIRSMNPDVITLDMEMPRMDGLEFLEKLMRLRPMPVVMVSAFAEANKTAWHDKVIVIGASTGGTEAVKDVLVQMPANAPGILVAQHMPEGFTRSFAARLDSLCAISVKEAVDGERVLPGHAYIAPGHSHLMLKKSGGGYATLLSQSDPVNRHRPSVDVLFRSAARSGAANVLAVILTGMGKDGAAGMAELRTQGAYTYAQDEASCVVFGMPKEAIAQGGVEEILPLADIASALLARLAVPGSARR